MNKNLTEIIVVLDRSGSMQACRDSAEKGLNKLIEEQQGQPGEARMTLVTFNQYATTIFQGRKIDQVRPVQLHPSGNTALLDAVGHTIDSVGARLAALPEEERPGLVLFVIITDGEENSSHSYSRAKIKEMVQHQASKYNWQFLYLGANVDAFTEAGGLGIGPAFAADYSVLRAANAFGVVSQKMSAARHTGLLDAYDDKERASIT